MIDKGKWNHATNWAAQERLRWIEFLLWWRGWVGRGDLLETFGISSAQASGDLQRYAEINPEAMIYQTSRKRYEARQDMECQMLRPTFEEAVRVFFGGKSNEISRTGEIAGEDQIHWTLPGIETAKSAKFRKSSDVDLRNPSDDDDDDEVADPNVRRQYRRKKHAMRENPLVEEGDPRLAILRLPKRRVNEQVARRVVMAILGEYELKVRYTSIHSGEDAWRVIVPRAVAWDGHRWHVRAWCRKHEEWRDFVIGRIAEVVWPKEEAGKLPKDVDWQTIETIKLRLHPSLDVSQRAALRLDYGLLDDELVLHVRRAMKIYWLASMQVEDVSITDEIPRHFIVDQPDPEFDFNT